MAVATSTAILIAAGTALAAGAANAGINAQQAHQQRKAAKNQQRNAERIQKEQEAEALATRKEQIDKQRESLMGGYKTKTTQTPQASGLTGRLENDILG